MKYYIMVAVFITVTIVGKSYAFTNTYTIKNIGSAISTVSQGISSVPALVTSKTVASGATAVAETVALNIPASRAAKIATAVLMVGGAYVADKAFNALYDWAKSKNFDYRNDMLNYYTSGYSLPPGFYCQEGFSCMIVGYYPTMIDAYHACDAVGNGTTWQGVNNAYYWNYNGWNYYYVVSENPPEPIKQYTEPTTTQLNNLQTAMINELNAGNQATIDAVNSAVNKVSAQLSGQINGLSAQMSIIQAELDACIPDELKTSMDATSTNQTATQSIAQVTGATQTFNQYQAQVNGQQSETITSNVPAYTGGNAIKNQEYQTPEVGDFAGLFSSFLDTMKNSSLFSLPGLLTNTIPAGGSCETTIDCGETFGGRKTFSICEWETGLSGFKCCVLLCCFYVAVRIVTKGGA